METEVLGTLRLSCRWWTADDLPLARQLWGDPLVTQYVGGPWPEERIAARLQRYIELQAPCGITYWPWFTRGGADFIGCCGLKPLPPEQDSAPGALETGFYLRPGFWGQGYGAEMARAVIAHAFTALGAQALWAGRHPANAASGRLLARLGFREHGTEFYEPIGMDQPTYLLTASDYFASQP